MTRRIRKFLAALAARAAIPHRLVEKLQMKVAWMMPRWLVYWCSIRLIANATTGKYGSTVVPELPAMEALKRWETVAGTLLLVLGLAWHSPAIAADQNPPKAVPVKAAPVAATPSNIYAYGDAGIGWSKTQNDLTLPGLDVQGSPKEYPTGTWLGGGIGMAAPNSTIGYLGIQLDAKYGFTRSSIGCAAVVGCAGYSKNSWRFAQELQWSPFATPAQLNGALPTQAQAAHWPIPITTSGNWATSIMFLPTVGVAERSLDICATNIAATAAGEASTACDTRWLVGPTAGLDVRFPWTAQLDFKVSYRHDWYRTSVNSKDSPVFGSSTFKVQDVDLATAGVVYHF